MEVATDDGQGDVALEAVDPVVGADVQTVYFEGVDRRLDGRVAVAQSHEARAALMLEPSLRALALLREYGKLDDLGETALVLGAVEASIHGATPWPKRGLPRSTTSITIGTLEFHANPCLSLSFQS